MNYLLFNPHSGKGASRALAEEYAKKLGENAKTVDMTEIKSYKEFFEGTVQGDEIVIFGGDGTLNRFVNDSCDAEIKIPIKYFPAGTGNDFAADIDKKDTDEPFAVDGYIKGLPTVEVNGEKYRFINGVGYGIDGYCCEVGDKLRAEKKKVDYTAIAIKGLLFNFKPVNAKVVVDGVEREYKKVWIAPTMYGRHYGGGMMPTPEQKRDDGKLSLMLFHGSGKLKTLMIFPSIFKGEHIKNTKYIEVIKGQDIRVSFDRPTALQIDGETHLGVSEYRAVSAARVEEKAEQAELV